MGSAAFVFFKDNFIQTNWRQPTRQEFTYVHRNSPAVFVRVVP